MCLFTGDVTFLFTPLFTPLFAPCGCSQVTVVAPPSSVVKCLWEVSVWGFRVLFLSCACVSVSGVLFSVGVCVWPVDLFTGDRGWVPRPRDLFIHTSVHISFYIYLSITSIHTIFLFTGDRGWVPRQRDPFIHTPYPCSHPCSHLYSHHFPVHRWPWLSSSTAWRPAWTTRSQRSSRRFSRSRASPSSSPQRCEITINIIFINYYTNRNSNIRILEGVAEDPQEAGNHLQAIHKGVHVHINIVTSNSNSIICVLEGVAEDPQEAGHHLQAIHEGVHLHINIVTSSSSNSIICVLEGVAEDP